MTNSSINIKQFKFSPEDFDKIKSYHFGTDWPVVYLLKNTKELYVGETINFYNRCNEHYKNKPERQRLQESFVITDEEYNKSATLDIESWLIQYMIADGKFTLQNGNGGLQNHSYYDREKYKAKFENIWEELRKMGLASKSIHELRNSDIFKYSPYKALSEDQIETVSEIIDTLKKIKHLYLS